MSAVVALTRDQVSHPCGGSRPLALAERCEREGLDNCAATIRGLLEERELLRDIILAAQDGYELGDIRMQRVLRRASEMLRVRMAVP